MVDELIAGFGNALTFYNEPLAAIAFLVGISKGLTAGSAAILMNTPGEPSSTPTALAGYPPARAGKAQKALKMGLFASVIGDFVFTCVLTCWRKSWPTTP